MKKIAALILVLTALLPLASCADKTEPEANDWIMWENAAAPEDSYPDYEAQPAAPAVEEVLNYETRYIKIYEYSAHHKGNIKAICGGDACWIVTKDNKIFNAPYSTDYQHTAPDTEIKSMSIHGNVAVYEGADGYTYLGCTPIVSEIKGEIICNMGGSWSDIISYADGKLYYNCFAGTGALMSTPNEEMYIREYWHGEHIEQIDSIEVRRLNYRLYFLVRSGDRTFFGTPNMISIDFDKVPNFNLCELHTDYSIILDYGYTRNDYASPLYAKSADATELYFTLGYQGQNEYRILLPEGYTVADIEQAIFNDTVLVRFKDGTVYTNELTINIVGTKLHLNEHLTEITQAGHVVKFYIADGDEILMHCDDDVIYIYED